MLFTELPMLMFGYVSVSSLTLLLDSVDHILPQFVPIIIFAFRTLMECFLCFFFRRLDAREDPLWQPEKEEAAVATKNKAAIASTRSELFAGLQLAMGDLVARPERVIAVATHWGVMHSLLDVDSR